ncbi:MAG: helix-turn-helix domain-containing protein [Hyphomicrobiales bacterium]|nr:helix-turn-helix domain-containing protein [Hyphomicrobiales bacterium]
MSRKTAFEKIKEGLDEALTIARGDAAPAKLFIPAEIDVKAIRTKLKLTQDDFAALFGFTVNQIREWEQGRARPLGGVRAYLLIIDRDPDRILGLLRVPQSQIPEVRLTASTNQINLLGRNASQGSVFSGLRPRKEVAMVKQQIGRDAKTGRIIPVEEAKRRRNTATVETIKKDNKGKK